MKGNAKVLNGLILNYMLLCDLGARPNTIQGLWQYYMEVVK